MDLTTLRLFAAFVIIVIVAFLLRQRYGNIYLGMRQAIERATGLPMPVIVRGLGIATIVLWALVYILFGGEEETGLEQLFRGIFRDADQTGTR